MKLKIECVKDVMEELESLRLKAIGDVAMDMLKEKLKSELSLKARLFSRWI